jgi:DNA-binding winged helix-turn-helix (wHTH) protein
MKQLLEFGLFRIDPQERVLLRGDEQIPLTPKAFDLLMLLVERSGQVVLKDDLMKLLWPDTFVEESNLGQHVFQLRKALGERAQGSSYIVTVPGRGYRFASPVRTLPDEETILVASHTRSRVLIDAKITADAIQGTPDIGLFPEREPKALPGTVSGMAGRRRTIAGLVLAGALVGAVVVWAFVGPVPMPKVVRTVQVTQSGRVEPYGRALTDGPRVFFAERVGGTGSLAQVAEQGGPSATISTSVDHPDLQILIASAAGCWSLRETKWTSAACFGLWLHPAVPDAVSATCWPTMPPGHQMASASHVHGFPNCLLLETMASKCASCSQHLA